jgi:hypothetical protein
MPKSLDCSLHKRCKVNRQEPMSNDPVFLEERRQCKRHRSAYARHRGSYLRRPCHQHVAIQSTTKSPQPASTSHDLIDLRYGFRSKQVGTTVVTSRAATGANPAQRVNQACDLLLARCKNQDQRQVDAFWQCNDVHTRRPVQGCAVAYPIALDGPTASRRGGTLAQPERRPSFASAQRAGDTR